MNKKTIIVLLTAISLQATAQTVYRSVDKEGNITFSDAPPEGKADVTQIEVDAPPPSAAAQREAEQRTQQMIGAAKESSQTGESSGPDKADQVRAAEQSLKEAQSNLEEAKVVGPGDRRGTAGGGSRLTPEYLQRVEKAEQQVEAARQQLKDVKSGR